MSGIAKIDNIDVKYIVKYILKHMNLKRLLSNRNKVMSFIKYDDTLICFIFLIVSQFI